MAYIAHEIGVNHLWMVHPYGHGGNAGKEIKVFFARSGLDEIRAVRTGKVDHVIETIHELVSSELFVNVIGRDVEARCIHDLQI